MWTLDPYKQNLQKQIWFSEKKQRFYGQLKVAGFVEKIIQKSSAPNTQMDRHMIMRFYSMVEEDAI